MHDLPGEPEGSNRILTLSQQVSRAMFWNAALQPAQLVAGLVSGLIVGNLLTPDAKGIVVVLGAMATSLGLLGDTGVERSLVRFLPDIAARHGRAGVERTLRLVFVQKGAVLTALAVAILVCQPWFLNLWRSRLREPDQIALLNAHHELLLGALLALIGCGAVFDVYMQTLVASFRQRAWNGIALLTGLLRPVLLAGVVLAGTGVFGVVAVFVTVPVAAVALSMRQSRALLVTIPLQPTDVGSGEPLIGRFLAYAVLSFAIQVSEFSYSLDLAVLALPSLKLAAGFQVAWALVAQILIALRSPLVGIQIPLFSRLQQRGDARQISEAYALLSRFLAAIFIPAAIGLSLLAPPLLALLWPQYAAFGVVASIVGCFLCLDAAIGVPRALLMAAERYRPILLSQGCALVGLPIVFLVAPRYSVVGVALTLGGTRLICGLLTLVLAQRQLGLRYPLAFVRRVGAASGVMALAVVPFAIGIQAPPPTLPIGQRLLWLAGVFALGLLGAVVYLGILRLTGGIEASDRHRLANLGVPGTTFMLRFL